MFTPAPLENFSEDKLNFKSFADDLTNIIMSPLPHPTNEYSKVIALNSGWGTGKTSFINMWTNELKKSNSKFICHTYNAWENDDSPDALIPILCSFQQLIGSIDSDDKKKRLMIWIKKKRLMKRLKDVISISVSVSVFNFLTVNVVGDIEKSPDTILEEFSARQKHKEELKELIGRIRGEHDYLLICIDELDRCRPTFAIETLEVVKHFFNVPNVVFVFSLDMDQLQKSIKILYGDIDSMGYLQRFFDHTISLHAPSKLDNFLNERFVLSPDEIDILSSLTRRFPISLRVLNEICVAYRQLREYMLTTIYAPPEGDRRGIMLQIYLLFIAMKYSHPEEYWSLLQKGSSNELGREILGFMKSPSWSSIYTEKSAHLTLPYNCTVEDRNKWYRMINCLSLIAVCNCDEPIYKLIDRNIENSLLKAKWMEIT